MTNQVKLHVGYIGKTIEGKRVEATSKTFDGYYKCSDGVRRDEEGSAWGLPEEYDIIGPWIEDKPEYETGVWYGWNGGECPVHPETVVDGLERYGGMWTAKAGENHWGSFHGAFRIVTPYVEPGPKLDGTTLMFDPSVYTVWYDNQTKMVHVQRMIEAEE